VRPVRGDGDRIPGQEGHSFVIEQDVLSRVDILFLKKKKSVINDLHGRGPLTMLQHRQARVCKSYIIAHPALVIASPVLKRHHFQEVPF